MTGSKPSAAERKVRNSESFSANRTSLHSLRFCPSGLSTSHTGIETKNKWHAPGHYCQSEKKSSPDLSLLRELVTRHNAAAHKRTPERTAKVSEKSCSRKVSCSVLQVARS